MASATPERLCAEIFDQFSANLALDESHHPRNDWPQDVAQFGKTLTTILTTYLNPANNVEASQCARQINQALPGISHKEYAPDVTLELWAIIFDAAALIPEDNELQDRLALLIVEIKALPESETLPIFGDYIASEDVRISEMPGLVTTYDDSGSWLNQVGAMDDVPDHDTNDNVTEDERDSAEIATRIDAFVARLYGRGIDLDALAIRGLWLIREGPMETPFSYELHLNGMVQACALWVKYAGNAFSTWRYQPMNKDDDFLERALRGGELWHGAPGMNAERWKFWRQRFTEFAADPRANEKTQRLAFEAAELMDEIP